MLTAALIVGWVVIGAVAVAVMRHRGHDWFAWAVPFLFLGPLAIPLAVSADRHRPTDPARPLPPGGLDVLVCHDGSPDADGALDTALELLGGRMTSLTLAAVVDFEASTTARGRDAQRDAQQRLDTVAGRVAASVTAPVATVILCGEPAHALQHFAVEQGYELIVTGSRAAARTHLGDQRLARKLEARRCVPVLVGPTAP